MPLSDLAYLRYKVLFPVSSMMATKAVLFSVLAPFLWFVFVSKSDEQFVKTRRPAEVSSLKLDPSFIFPKSSPGLAYLAVDEFVDVGINRYRDVSKTFVTTLNWETWKDVTYVLSMLNDFKTINFQ